VKSQVFQENNNFPALIASDAAAKNWSAETGLENAINDVILHRRSYDDATQAPIRGVRILKILEHEDPQFH